MTAGVGGLALMAILLAAAVTAYGGRRRVRRRLNRQLVDRADASDPRVFGEGSKTVVIGDAGLRDTAMLLELIGAMLDAGTGIGRSLELVAALAAPEIGVPLRPVVSALAIGAGWDTAWRSSSVRSPGLLALRDAVGFAALTGAPSSAILYAQAARIRREQFRAAEKQAAALGVKLVVPLGLCSLPAFVCLGVVPVLLAMLPS